MQFLCGPPRTAVAIFAKVFHHQPHILKMTNACFRMTKPKTFRVASHQCCRARTQFRRSGRGRRQFAQFIRFGSHETNVKTNPAHGKETLLRVRMPDATPSPSPLCPGGIARYQM